MVKTNKSESLLHFVQRGTGSPVIFLHAFPLTSAMWATQMKSLSRFCRVICPDLPGFGQSPRLAEPSIASMAEAVSETLKSLKIRKPVFMVGLSMGGYVALEFARQFPKQVRGLALLSTRAGADSAEQKKKRGAVAAQVRAEGLDVISENVLPKLLGKTTRQKKPKVLTALKAMLEKNKPLGVADSLMAMAHRRDLNALLQKITCPVLIAAGTSDEDIPFTEAVMMHEAIALGRLQLIEGAGHLINLEQPEIVDGMLTRFIRAAVG